MSESKPNYTTVILSGIEKKREYTASIHPLGSPQTTLLWMKPTSCIPKLLPTNNYSRKQLINRRNLVLENNANQKSASFILTPTFDKTRTFNPTREDFDAKTMTTLAQAVNGKAWYCLYYTKVIFNKTFRLTNFCLLHSLTLADDCCESELSSVRQILFHSLFYAHTPSLFCTSLCYIS